LGVSVHQNWNSQPPASLTLESPL